MILFLKTNQGKQGFMYQDLSGRKNNVIQVQKPDLKTHNK